MHHLIKPGYHVTTVSWLLYSLSLLPPLIVTPPQTDQINLRVDEENLTKQIQQWVKCFDKNLFYRILVTSEGHIKQQTHLFLEAKASKGIQPGLYWKITWPPIIYTSVLKIVPLVVRIYPVGFVKCFNVAVFCSFWISPVNCKSKKKKTTLFLLL